MPSFTTSEGANTTDVTPPGAPTALSATTIPGGFRASWTGANATDLAGYVVHWFDTNDNNASDPGDDFDYIREITFRESRNYVIKVLSSYRAYQALDTELVSHTGEIVGSFVDWDLFIEDLPAVQ